jgi:NCS2 family nucleobase:cation symporter-2
MDVAAKTLADENLTASPILIRYGVEDRPSPPATVLFAIQHVMIMFGAMLASPLAISQLLNFDAGTRATLVTGVMLGCGIGTMISSLGVWWIGSRLPLLLGGYTAFIAPFVAIAKVESPAAAFTAMMLGGLALFVVSPLIGKLKNLFPPLVVGILLLITGINLIKVVGSLAFAVNTPFAGKPITLAMLIASMLVIVLIFSATKGFLRPLAVFVTVVLAYLAAAALGLANPGPLLAAPWFSLPAILPFGLTWPSPGALASIFIYQLVAAMYTLSITLALCDMLGVAATEQRVRGAVAADGLGSAISTLFGGVPLISYDQNVGAVALTGVGSRFVVAVSGLLLVIIACMPKVTALALIVPPFVLGGVLVFMFGMISVVGVRILASSLNSQRDLLVMAISLGVSATVWFAPPSVFEVFSASWRIVVGDGIVMGTLTAVVLNLVLPTERVRG